MAERRALFQYGNFKLHSGARSRFKIDCDALTAEDWATLAEIAVRRVGAFSTVWSCGGASERFAVALRAHLDSDGPALIVDDVLTTGETITDMRNALTPNSPAVRFLYKGLVVFARGKCPKWVTPLFQYTGED